MSVLIKDMGKPKSCYAVIDGESEYCPFVNTDDDCVLLLKKGTCEWTWAEQYSKCPLIEVSELCEDAVSRQAAIDGADGRMKMTREDAKAFMRKEWRETMKGSYAEAAFEMAIKALEQPTIEPERKTGKWIEYNATGKKQWMCSECCAEEKNPKVARFCYWCGADMRGEEDNIPIEYFENGGI